MISYFLKGGPLMWPILLCSLTAVAIIIERLLFYHRIRIDEEKFVQEIKKFLDKKDIAGAIKYCESHTGPIATVIYAGLKNYPGPPAEREKAIDLANLYVIPALQKYLPLLSTIASISTLLGFTGTVTGMIRAFNAIVQHGVSSPTIVAAGIAEALITTAAGLFVAIPTQIFYHYFSYRVERIILSIERAVGELLK